ncbi:Zinc finger protein 26 [Trichinella britovi]|uniref:Zinc finger protein 26 n=1 Tax=Trichinella britovi TaxID=45882 RepID=A0A0V1CHL4_TRIBR|nr:Zinc finger protein 26 [Trichinella britovi]
MVQKNLESQVNDRNKQSVPLNNETKVIFRRDEIVQAVPAAKSDSVQCNICKKYFSSNSLRRKHEKEEHPWNLECKVCSLYFQTQANLDFHMRTHEKKQDRINMIQEHFQVVLENKQRIKYQCLTCSKNLISKNSLMNHVKMHKNFEKTLCPICPMRFRSKISLSNHLSRVHGKEDPMNQPTESKDKIENFSDLHGNEVQFMVQKNLESQVNDRNKQSVPLNNETKVIFRRDEIVQAVPAAKSDSVQCNICKKYFSSNSLRRKHEKEEHPWNLECKVCSLYFQTQANLDFHMRTHEKKQDRINMIQEHFQVVLENKQRIKYQCLTCSKNLISKNSLMNHVKMHKNFEKTLCPICPMRFRSKISLSNHLSRVHGKEDPMNQPTESKDKIENFSDLHGNEVQFDVRSDENTYSELELW